jgi:hypothetical protein
MLFRVMVMVSIAALALSLAACAETGTALAAAAAEQAAMIAATQATIATTQAIDQLEAASTQMSTQGQIQAGKSLGMSNMPHLPPVGKGTMIIFTPTMMIIQKDGKRLVIPRQQYYNDNTDQSQ